MQRDPSHIPTKRTADAIPEQPDPSTITSEKQANFYRMQCIREIARLMSKLSDTTIPEVKLRLYNTQANKLLQQKARWASRVIELGGRIPLPPGGRVEDEIAVDLTYRYFGLAKGLPGVNEILPQKNKSKAPDQVVGNEDGKTISRAALYQRVDLEYFEFVDTVDADPVLKRLEEEAQLKMISSLRNNRQEQSDNQPIEQITCQEIYQSVDPSRTFPFTERIPSSQEVSEFLILQKKKLLLSKYAA